MRSAGSEMNYTPVESLSPLFDNGEKIMICYGTVAMGTCPYLCEITQSLGSSFPLGKKKKKGLLSV